MRLQCAVVIGDSGRLSQIVINIVSNALKYTEAGGHIEVSLDALPQNRYRFVCKDDGIGMSEEFLKHITDDYARAEDSRISKIQGTGLGMSIVNKLTKLMGGTLSVESRLGKGSVFTVEIPLEPASPEQRSEILAPEHTEADRQQLKGKRVLLADDNALNAEIATELMQSLGLVVDWAENGAIAAEKLENSAPNTYFAIFIDMQMPVMDGVEATRKIRSSHHADNGIPIIAMTANTFDADKKRCIDAGMNGYISKPINSEAIVKALVKYR
ncbi:MAG: ATP-binding protein [Oscillospiraceae bacterium]|nr:ATP-binding protein [Oscillospiraceae bacterium]